MFMLCSEIMNQSTAIPADFPPPDAPLDVEALDRARLRLERQLDMLEQLAEAGLEVALAIRDQATGRAPEGTPPVARGDIAMAYARAARAVRFSIVLQSKLTADLQAIETDAVQARDEAEELAFLQTPHSVRRAAVEHIVESVVRAEREPGEGAPALEARIDRLVCEAADRLEHEELYGDILARPISEVVADLCRDLGLHPDWPALADAAWARREIDSGIVGAPLVHLPPRGGGSSVPDADPAIPDAAPVIPNLMSDPPPDDPSAPFGERANLL